MGAGEDGHTNGLVHLFLVEGGGLLANVSKFYDAYQVTSTYTLHQVVQDTLLHTMKTVYLHDFREPSMKSTKEIQCYNRQQGMDEDGPPRLFLWNERGCPYPPHVCVRAVLGTYLCSSHSFDFQQQVHKCHSHFLRIVMETVSECEQKLF
jgi:hypothetical protein